MVPKPQDMPYANAVEFLIARFPELASDFAKTLEWWGDEIPGAHVVYGDVFCPFIDRVFTSGDQQTRQRVFEFLEELAGGSDLRVQELFGVTVYPYLRDDPTRLRLARRHFGRAFKETREGCRCLEDPSRADGFRRAIAREQPRA